MNYGPATRVCCSHRIVCQYWSTPIASHQTCSCLCTCQASHSAPSHLVPNLRSPHSSFPSTQSWSISYLSGPHVADYQPFTPLTYHLCYRIWMVSLLLSVDWNLWLPHGREYETDVDTSVYLLSRLALDSVSASLQFHLLMWSTLSGHQDWLWTRLYWGLFFDFCQGHHPAPESLPTTGSCLFVWVQTVSHWHSWCRCGSWSERSRPHDWSHFSCSYS